MSKTLFVDENARFATEQEFNARQNQNWAALEAAVAMQDSPEKARAMFDILANSNFLLLGTRDIKVKLGDRDFELNRNEYLVLQCARLVKLRANDTIVADWQRLLSSVSAHSPKICERVALMMLNHAEKMTDFQVVVGSEMGSAKGELANMAIIYARNSTIDNEVCQRALAILETSNKAKADYWVKYRDLMRKALAERSKQNVA